eukprot:3166680-Pyramimonas_sp.AAC.1
MSASGPVGEVACPLSKFRSTPLQYVKCTTSWSDTLMGEEHGQQLAADDRLPVARQGAPNRHLQ